MDKTEADLLRKERQWFGIYNKLHNFIKTHISCSKKHLDFGCGYGNFAYFLACEYPKMQVVGIDMNRKKILAGMKRYNAPNLKIKASSKVNGKFDSISCFFVLHEIVGNLEEYVNCFYNHLNSNGKIFVLDYRRVSREKFKKLYYQPRLQKLKKSKFKLYKLESFEEEYKHHSKWNMKQFEEIFKKNGFKTLTIRPVTGLHCLYVGIKR
jgi:ubiquinone/menaquinone biosynthesis C-methylase UbiE